MKTSTLTSLSALTAILLLGGCGSDSTTTPLATPSVEAEPTDIIVERGPVLGATVIDSAGQIGTSQGNGRYRFYEPQYPIYSYGGVIDVNRDGSINAGDMNMTRLHLSTDQGDVMTMATTMARNNELYNYMNTLGLSSDALLQERPSTNMDNAALSDEMYKYCIENNISDPSQITRSAMEQIEMQIRERMNRYSVTALSQAELEALLINVELQLETLDDSTAAVASQQQTLDNLPAYDLNNEQRYTLAYMWNEEKLAKDIYLQLNALTPSNTLYNIATRSEAQHQDAVETLIEKYDINILNTDDYSGGYDAQALTAYSSGLYSLQSITELYDALYAKGSQSMQDALEVGCMVEVTDINDLEEDIITAGDALDLVTVFENLKAGSYSHYWSFDTALKALGVNEGCCVLGETYCKSSDEYPQNSTGSGSSGNGNGSGSHVKK